MQERTITVNGFSKAYAMTGWRLGYLTAPPEILKLLLKIQSHSVSSATTFVQYGGLEALQGPQDSVKAMVDRFKVRRDVLVDAAVVNCRLFESHGRAALSSCIECANKYESQDGNNLFHRNDFYLV